MGSSPDKKSVDFHIVGIGASAGGLDALIKFFSNMPADSGLAFVIIQHLSPDHKSMMGEILKRYSEMNIKFISDGMDILPNNIYLIPPKNYVTIYHQQLFLNNWNQEGSPHYPVDSFFETLASDVGERAIGVILSGTGSDGTIGIRAIKEAGGMVVLQGETTAQFDGMPRSAIATGLADFIGSPEDIPRMITNYLKNPISSIEERIEALPSSDSIVIQKMLHYIRTKKNVDFSLYKEKSVLRRIKKRINIHQLENFERYYKYLVTTPSEINHLYHDILISVTHFFRDPEAFAFLKDHIIPKIFKDNTANKSIRIWVVGCSTGEEVYSVAFLFSEYMEQIQDHFEIKIFATDIHKDLLQLASRGQFDDNIVTRLTPDQIHNYFIREENGFRIKEFIRNMVIFAKHNILIDPPFSKIDLISCRNLIIYLKKEAQKNMLSLFHFALKPTGYLFLGSSESIGDLSPYFKLIDAKSKIFQFKGGLKSPTLGNLTRHNFDEELPVHPENRRNNKIIQNDVEQAKDALLREYVPPSVLVSEKLEVLHIYNDVNAFLNLPQGKLTSNILKMARGDLSIAISTAIQKTVEENTRVVFRDVKLAWEDKILTFNLVANPLTDSEQGNRRIVLSFEQPKSRALRPQDGEDFEIVEQSKQRIQNLELELVRKQEYVQSTIEELETTNEELQATNEELVAANEELQSTNEELQSVNEELQTINSEYQHKIEEQIELENDMNNLLMVTRIGVLYLDENLRVRKFSPNITQVINLIESDIGRPIRDISWNFDYNDFLEDIQNVNTSLMKKVTRVTSKKGGRYLVRINPYRTLNNIVRGVSITVIDTNEII